MLAHSASHIGPLHDGVRGPRLIHRPAAVEPSIDGVTGCPPDTLAPSYSSVATAHGLDAGVLDVMLEQLPLGVLVADRDGRVVYANGAARDLGLADGAALRWTIMRALLTGDRVRGEAITLPTPGWPPRRLSVDVVPALRAGAADAVVLTVADVTARSQAAEWQPLIESLMNL